MTRSTLSSLVLTGSFALLLGGPALAQGDPGTPGAPSGPGEPSGPSSPSYLPTAPAPVADPTEDEVSFARPRIAIIPFIETYSADGVIVATGGIGEILGTEMQKTGRFNIVAKKEQLKELIQNAQIEQSGLYDLSTVAGLGQYKGAEYLFQGRVTGARLKSKDTKILGFGTGGESATIRIDFALYKAETGEMVYSGSGEGTSKTTNIHLGGYGAAGQSGTSAGMFDGAISKACADIVSNIIKTDLFPVRAAIKGTAGDKVIIDLGQSAGLYPGIKLDLREINILTDDETGEVLFHELGNIRGSLVLDQVQIDRSMGHIVGSYKPKKGDVAEVPKGTDLRHMDEAAAENANNDRENRDRDDE
ncbi:MAG TPA: CsgG/HfaB family protein [bacterium]|nr:CsgG/HfaB family protein [bacterium]